MLKTFAGLCIYSGFVLLLFINSLSGNTKQLLSIEEILMDKNKDYVPDRLGEIVSICGEVTLGSDVLGSNRMEVFIQDNTGGILLFSMDKRILLSAGDNICISGKVDQYHGLTQIIETRVDSAIASTLDIEPAVISSGEINLENFEGQLVIVEGKVLNKGSNSGGYFLTIDRGSNQQVNVFISYTHNDKKLNIDRIEIGDYLIITGILSQFDSDPPYNEFYQLIPRSAKDLLIKGFPRIYLRYFIYVFVVLLIGGIPWVIALKIQVKKRTKELIKSEKQYRDLFENSKDANLIIKNRQFVDCNKATVKMLGYRDKKELLKTHPSELSPEKQPDGRSSFKKAEEMMEIALKNGSHRFEWAHKRSDGEIFIAEVSLTVISTENNNEIIHTVWKDIQDYKLAEKQLRDSEKKYRELAERLTQMNTMREMFLDVITHDLKNSAGVINGLSEIMVERNKKDEIAVSVRESSRKILEVIEHVSTLSKVAIGENIKKIKMDIVPLIQRVAEEYKSQLILTGMELRLDFPNPVIIYVNPIISQVFKNYISNAIKYSVKGKKIIIDSTSKEEWITFRVSDFGHTIPKEKRDIIFERGIQLEENENSKSGRGLGLAIIKRIVEAHGGTVGVEPNTPTGNIFFFRMLIH